MNDNIAIKVDNVSKVFPLRQPKVDENGNTIHEHWALKDVSFEIKKGESVGIIGPNGSGKSTLLKILAGVTKPTSGSISIRGKVASILDIGAGFHPELSGRENVFLNGQIHGFSKKEINSKFEEIVAFSGIEKFIDEPVKNYSNGMYLRLAFSIMAYLDFDVYLFDEVLSVGDAEFQAMSQKRVQELLFSNKTVLFITHNISELVNQSLFIQLAKGQLVKKTYDSKLLNDYLEDNLTKIGEQIYTRNALITDFSKYPTSDYFEIKRVELFQADEDFFQSHKPLKLTLQLGKKSSIDLIDIVIKISDIKSGVALTTTSLLEQKGNISTEGIYTYECTFPQNIFGFQTYKISAIFITNIYDNYQLISSNQATNSYHSIQNLIIFKLNFNVEQSSFNLENLNIGGGLFPILKWEINKEETK